MTRRPPLAWESIEYMAGYAGEADSRPRPTRGAARAARARPRSGSRGRWREAALAYAYLSPAFLLLVLFTLAPFLYVFFASVQRRPGAPTQQYVGLSTYAYLLDPAQQSGFLNALGATLYYVAGVAPGGVILSLLCALLLRRKVRGWSFFRLTFFLPYVTPALPTAIVWLYLFDPRAGLLNSLLRLVHLPALGWVDDPVWAMPSVIIYSLWQSAGFNTIVFLAALTAIPPELEEAARVDGAPAWAVARHITLPLLTPTIFFVFVVAMIESLKVFTQIYALTVGGPAGATTTVGVFLYQQFQSLNLGEASAVAVVMFALTMAFVLAQNALGRRWVFYG